MCAYFRVCGQSLSCLRIATVFFFLMIRRPPRSTLDRSSAASDVYKRQVTVFPAREDGTPELSVHFSTSDPLYSAEYLDADGGEVRRRAHDAFPVSYTHLRAHETVLDLVCRLLLEKKNTAQCHMQ